MIASSIDIGALAARLDRAPAQLRTALAREFAALAQRLHTTASIGTTADIVTATIRTAGVPPAIKRRMGPRRPRSQLRQRLRALRVPSASFALTDFLSASIVDMREALDAAAREAFAP